MVFSNMGYQPFYTKFRQHSKLCLSLRIIQNVKKKELNITNYIKKSQLLYGSLVLS